MSCAVRWPNDRHQMWHSAHLAVILHPLRQPALRVGERGCLDAGAWAVRAGRERRAGRVGQLLDVAQRLLASVAVQVGERLALGEALVAQRLLRSKRGARGTRMQRRPAAEDHITTATSTDTATTAMSLRVAGGFARPTDRVPPDICSTRGALSDLPRAPRIPADSLAGTRCTPAALGLVGWLPSCALLARCDAGRRGSRGPS